jgi:alkanesulfonate monooxygenase SsuD/methylene tetrahydromethanopterin reductase-like flavin-dependent oxidoreductase (luciferase family)
VPIAVLSKQVAAHTAAVEALAGEGFDAVVKARPVLFARAAMSGAAPAAARQAERPVGLRIGLHLSAFEWPGGAPALAANLRSVATAAEAAGLDSVWLMDHLRQIPQVGSAWHDMPECWTTLGFLAAATERVRLGALVTCIAHRHVSLLGRIAATLDVLSGGRAVCGIGLGWFDAEQRALGMEPLALARRYDLVEDALRYLPLLWGKGAPAFEGKVLRVPEALGYPRPLQQKLPILLGGSGERRTLRLAAELADACNLFGDAPTVRHKVGVLHEHCRAVERDPAEVEVTHLSTVLVGSNPAAVDAAVDRLRPPRMGAAAFATRVNAGTVEQHVGRLRLLAEAGVQHAIVSVAGLQRPDDLEPLAAVAEAYRRG